MTDGERDTRARIEAQIRKRCRHEQTLESSAFSAASAWPDREWPFEVVVHGASFELCKICGRALGPPHVLRDLQAVASAGAGAGAGRAAVARLELWHHEAAVAHQAPTEAMSSERPDRSGPDRNGDNSSEGVEARTETPRFRLSDLILDPKTRLELDQALAKLRHHELIYERWGFEAADPTGKAVTLNFYGAPGTGKTRAAEAVAGELDLPLMRFSVGDLESRYLGDTPKNIRAAFEAAREARAVIFFDEADSLFGRRAADVTQGVDHEINAAKSTLLVELERFEGVVVLATNFPQNFDAAFVRRLAWHVPFHKPDEEARRRLWDLHLVDGIPLAEERDGLLDWLAQESEGLTGGDVLTGLRIALPACLIAADSLDQAELSRETLGEALVRVRRAKREVARGRTGSDGLTRAAMAALGSHGGDAGSNGGGQGPGAAEAAQQSVDDGSWPTPDDVVSGAEGVGTSNSDDKATEER